MFTTESRVYLTGAAVALVAAVAYTIGTNDNMGLVLFVSVLMAAVFLGFLFVRAGRLETSAPIGAVAEREGADRNLAAPTFWPLATAAGLGILAVGFVVDRATLVLGAGAVALAGLGWFGQVWRDHRERANPNAVIANERILAPAGLPLLAALGIGVLVVSFSRVLLASSQTGAWVIALAVAIATFGICALVALKPVSRGAGVGIAAVAAAAVVAGGVAAASRGERHYERHATPVVEISAEGTTFKETELELRAHETNLVRFFNADEGILHNVSFYKDDTLADPVFQGQVFPGPGQELYTFGLDEPGSLFYQCDFHPEQMTGTATVVESEEHGAGEGSGNDEEHD